MTEGDLAGGVECVLGCAYRSPARIIAASNVAAVSDETSSTEGRIEEDIVIRVS
jgi:hypothetical protein